MKTLDELKKKMQEPIAAPKEQEGCKHQVNVKSIEVAKTARKPQNARVQCSKCGASVVVFGCMYWKR